MSSLQDAIYGFVSDEVGRNATVTIETGIDLGDDDYGPDKLHDENPAQPAKIGSLTGAWQWQFDAPQRVDILSLIHCTFDEAVDLKFQARPDPSNWASPAFEVDIVVPAWRGRVGDLWPTNPFKVLTGEAGYSAGGWTYWRLIATGNSQAIWAGQAWLGSQVRRMDPNYRWGYTKNRIRPIVENRTSFGVSTIYDRLTNLWEFTCDLNATDSLADDILDQWFDVGGRAHPFLFVPDPTVNDAYYVRWKLSEEPMQVNFTNYVSMKLLLEEVGRGLRPGV